MTEPLWPDISVDALRSLLWRHLESHEDRFGDPHYMAGVFIQLEGLFGIDALALHRFWRFHYPARGVQFSTKDLIRHYDVAEKAERILSRRDRLRPTVDIGASG